jgi:hypothetical protein
VSDDKKSSSGSRRDAASVDKRLLGIVHDWVDRAIEAERDHLEAELDRASFESFPASDPVAPAVTSQRRAPFRIHCEVSGSRLSFSRAPRNEDPTGPAVRRDPSDTIEGTTASGARVRIEVHLQPDEASPESLELPPEHASAVARDEERRIGAERRIAERKHGNERRSGADRRAAA